MKRVEDIVTPQGRLKSEIRRKQSQKGQTKARTKKKPEVRVGKLGIVRLKGDDLTRLRLDCFERDRWRCQECGRGVSWGGIYPDTPQDVRNKVLSYAWDWERIGWMRGEMAHIHAKRNGGDVLSNVRTLCAEDHAKEHAYGKSMKKPCPKKERACGVQG